MSATAEVATGTPDPHEPMQGVLRAVWNTDTMQGKYEWTFNTQVAVKRTLGDAVAMLVGVARRRGRTDPDRWTLEVLVRKEDDPLRHEYSPKLSGWAAAEMRHLLASAPPSLLASAPPPLPEVPVEPPEEPTEEEPAPPPLPPAPRPPEDR